MDEKILIKSEQYNVKNFFKIMLIIGIVLTLLTLVIISIFCINVGASDYDYCYKTYLEHEERGYCDKYCYTCDDIEENPTKLGYILAVIENNMFWVLLISLIPVAAFSLIGGIVCLLFSGFELTVTDKRILGSIRKKRVDLPLDSVSAVSIGAFKSISVATSSGRISFSAIKNRNEIHKIISDLLVERQNQAPKSAATVVNTPATSNADELKKFKELLDAGIITQEEFDAKKKQLLGL